MPGWRKTGLCCGNASFLSGDCCILIYGREASRSVAMAHDRCTERWSKHIPGIEKGSRLSYQWQGARKPAIISPGRGGELTRMRGCVLEQFPEYIGETVSQQS